MATIEEWEQKFKYEDFDKKNIANLIANIWYYSGPHQGKYSVIYSNYRNWCITALKKKGKDRYIDFDFVVKRLCQRDRVWVSKLTIEHMHRLYTLIEGTIF